MATGRDRRRKLADQIAVNGIDFVEVDDTQTRLRVYFVNEQPDKDVLAIAVGDVTISGGERIATVAVETRHWDVVDRKPVLDLVVAAPGDFSTYTLRLVTGPAGALDPYFDHVDFSFKAGCRSTLDCEPAAPSCPPPADDSPPIDYLAKDFSSFTKALSNFSALRYPAWQERSEADFGVMFMEALASIADDLSYQQDRVAAEAWIDTATERRSLVRMARLVDYEPRVATAATTWLAFELVTGATDPIDAGVLITAQAPDGAPIDFETGTGLDDDTAYAADARWNAMTPYWWDDAQRCLPHGATEMWIEDPGVAWTGARPIFLDTTADPEADPPVRRLVRATFVRTATDPLYGDRVALIAWDAIDAPLVDHDLTRTRVLGNVVPATQGRRVTERFTTALSAWSPSSGVPRAIVRTGADRAPQFLYTLRQGPLTWLAVDDPSKPPRPELAIVEISDDGRPWLFARSLLDASQIQELVTIDPVRYRATDPDSGAVDYDGDDGDTLRFGDGVFGAIPVDGAMFEVTYRHGGGAIGNVAAGAIARVAPGQPIAAQVVAVMNPLAAGGGRDAETLDQIRERAPQAHRARQFRAVRAEDYAAAAMTLPWVQRAGTTFRYTGSWLTVFTAADPDGSEALSPRQAAQLTNLLDRYRLAGYESYALAPRYASIDLGITLCARPDAFRGDVKAAVLAALDNHDHPDGTRGFFHPDRFTFGVSLERSAIEAAVQEVPGVDGVIDVEYRRRGHTADLVAMPDFVAIAADEIVRVDNDPSRPERGSLRVDVVGGK